LKPQLFSKNERTNCELPDSNQKIDIDNKARFRYQVEYWCLLIDASICVAVTAADTQFSFFDSFTSKKQYLDSILYL
jgi:hypothetical protein